MKKIIIGISIIAANIIYTNATSISKIISGDNTEDVVNQQSEIDKLKNMERERLRKTQVKLQENPFAQKLLNDFLKNILEKSNEKISEMIDRRVSYINMKLRDEYNQKEKDYKENLKNQLFSFKESNLNNFNELKGTLKEELSKIENIKTNLTSKQIILDKKIDKLDNIFKELKLKIKAYTTYIDSKFSLKGVKETELSRILLLKEIFPIKYIKNYDDKSKITIVLNNNKEYSINSMITERCRIADLSRKHIKIQCIDVKNKLYENIMNLKITMPEDDYILNSIDKKIKMGNDDYTKVEKIVTGSNEKELNSKKLNKNINIDELLKIK